MYDQILEDLKPTNTLLVAVSKTKPVEDIVSLYDKGQRHFGENRVQELVDKYEALPKDIRWHQIGHLQKNKVKYIAPFVHLIHAIDSEELLTVVNKEAKKNERVIDVLLQVKIAQEDTKYGLSTSDLNIIIELYLAGTFENVRIIGLMGMASFTDNTGQVHDEFSHLKETFDILKKNSLADKEYFEHLSMGMSGDYKIAIEHGSTMVRVGSLLFGSRV